ncbi:glycosyltransferase family 39 protein [Nocardioides sp. C4-1]|uniref:glycosyltransferase family 39 protein n=1 Tax=Nocardioides sp. C4-1 TaxID=3151851 RepID=UPI00326518C9
MNIVRSPRPWLLLLAASVLYLWGLGSSGWANAYYSAAVQAGSESWRAMFFGSFDAAGSITVDKPPLSLWPMALSARVLGLSAWSMLLPQALMGVATVAVVHHGVRRATGSGGAALLAGAAMALTPVAVLMFRFNNPDGLLVLLLACAAVATLRAVEGERAVPWLVLAGSLVGLAFLTKMLQAFLVLPALAATYAVFATVPFWRRVGHLLIAFAAMVAAGSWWVVAVELWPRDDRPFIGGSQHNSAVELVLGYNGIGRLTGNQTGSVTTTTGGWGTTGPLRLLDPDTGGQASWLLPAAAVLAVTALWLTRRTTDRVRPALVLWLGWAGVTFLVFSQMNGIFHDYYTVALAPAVASMVGLGTHVLWQHRAERLAVRGMAAAVAATGVMALVVLWPQRGWQPWLPWLVAGLAVVAGWHLVRAHRHAVPLGTGFAAAALVMAFAGPAAYSVTTARTPHGGAVPAAGPHAASAPTYVGSRVGDLLATSTASPTLRRYLLRDAGSYTWVAAVTGANSAAGFQLATDRPVMPVGGFNGTDPSPTLRQFRRHVAADRIHFFIAGGGRLVKETGEAGPTGPGAAPEVVRTGSDVSERIERWVARRFSPVVIDGVTVYDLSPVPEPLWAAASRAASTGR